MLVSSTATMSADPATAYAAFHDERVLAATIPGVESFTPAVPGAFDIVLTMGVAAIKGTYKGSVSFSEEVENTSFLLSAKGAGGPGTIGADVRVTLVPGESGGSDITWEADAVLGGPIGGVGQRMLSGVAKRIATKFFKDIDKVIAEGVPAAVGDVSDASPAEVGPDGAGTSAEDSASTSVGAEPTAVSPAGAGALSSTSGAGVLAGVGAGCGGGASRSTDLLVGVAAGAGAALLGVCIGLLAGRR